MDICIYKEKVVPLQWMKGRIVRPIHIAINMMNYNMFLKLLMELQDLSMLDSFMLHEVLEENCFNLEFEYDAPYTCMVQPGVYVWIWCVDTCDVDYVNNKFVELGMDLHYRWDDNYSRHHWVFRVK